MGLDPFILLWCPQRHEQRIGPCGADQRDHTRVLGWGKFAFRRAIGAGDMAAGEHLHQLDCRALRHAGRRAEQEQTVAACGRKFRRVQHEVHAGDTRRDRRALQACGPL